MVKTQSNWIKRALGVEEPSLEEVNSDLIQRMRDDGDPLIKPRDIDFNHYFAEEDFALAFEQDVRAAGYSRIDHDFWNEWDAWITTVHVSMVPEVEKITAIELELDDIAARYGGKSDGWGCMEVI